MDRLYTLLITVPLLVVIIGLAYTIVRNISRLWLDHHVKLKLLEKLETRPDLLRSFDELQDLLDDAPQHAPERPQQLDFLVTGVVLGIIGIACAIISNTMGAGRGAAGMYFGGVACAVLGFILTLIGLLTRFLSRIPVTDAKRPPWYKRWFRRGEASEE